MSRHQSRSNNIESLEARKLLAGITLLTHGQGGNVEGWIETAADDIADRLGGSDNVSIARMKVDESGDDLAVTEFTTDSGYSEYRGTAAAELIIRLDWGDVSGGSYSTAEVAAVVANYMMARRTSQSLPPLAELPIHLVGHSRGASLIVELSRLFGQRGVIVDQVTFLDPHPVDGEEDILNADFGDVPMRVYDNVVFADNYWRTDGNTQNFDPDGEDVAGTFEAKLDVVQEDFSFSAHNAVTAYYVGTIDTDTNDGGDHPVFDSWYGDSNPDRDETGFAFARLGATASRPSSGIGAVGRGSASRTAAGMSGNQFASAAELKLKNGITTFAAGAQVQATVRGAFRGGSATVDLFLDTDRNPYNGAGPVVGTGLISGGVGDNTYTLTSTAGVSPGTYAFAARLSAGNGQTRWFYGRSLQVTANVDVGNIANSILTINGTTGGDTASLAVENGMLLARMNNNSSLYDFDDFERIEVLLDAGGDRFTSSDSITVGTYVLGGDGNDNLAGGGGSDTLTSGAGRNTLAGASGDDRLNSSGAGDTLSGGAGSDRLYGNGGPDVMDGGGSIDRLFGGAGDDSLVGGSSNDKLYGEADNDTLRGNAGADIADGGGGTDSSENDSLDMRTSIEVLL